MSALPSPPKEDDGVGSVLLDAAAADLLESLAESPDIRIHGAEEIERILAQIVDGVEASRGESEPEVFIGEISDRHLVHRLIDELRRRVIGLWKEESMSIPDSEASEILETVHLLETIRTELWPHGDEDLGLRFAGPDSFELLVEIAHDLRSPISSILFLSESIRAGRSGPINDLQRRQLGLIYSAAFGLMTVTNDVVDSAKGWGGRLIEEPAPFALREVFDRIRELLGPMAEEKGLDLRFELPADDFFEGRSSTLRRVLLNLAANGLKFTEEGGVTISASRTGPREMEFSVSDTGRGMNEDQIERLFQPFRRSESRSGHFFSGSGLGLSIARRLLGTMDADLEVESEVGAGTRFSFRLHLPSISSL